MTVIEARGLHKAFGSTIALDSVNLHVEEGRILGIIGPNGAGKSTALNAMLGLTPYQGELKVLDEIHGPSEINLCRMFVSSPMWRCCRAGCGFRRRWIM
jgi:ABC-type multidrug transport system ATPase subunit